ncbi:nuclear transport factor 2 family protein [Novosphingobium jiangmenense]|uniref:Nuclear transport factor 2 family protein n=1 Tax=Novosphingobium jiangmenense TaxID=2791981 RepID=A0ABS0HC01_9SPHN|nr:nuclear transport factor 2 family protein [Novosphingobium jiangmenense]MBF9149540.1 nuclear transport factor 2 family protein [Novosphingobium jiangmenense]
MPFTGPIEDRTAIRELMDTHAHGVMTLDAELWGSIWAEDAYWELPEYPDLGGFSGKAAIVAGWTESMKHYGLDNCSKPMVYFMQPGSIEVEGDTAKAVAYTIEIFDDPASGKRIHATGRYDDELARIDGAWKFTRRSYRTVFAD